MLQKKQIIFNYFAINIPDKIILSRFVFCYFTTEITDCKKFIRTYTDYYRLTQTKKGKYRLKQLVIITAKIL